jgi:F420-0:gamma-glutamyl ligase-like protein
LRTAREETSLRYQTIALITGYWRPGENHTERIIEALKGKVQDGDIVTVSEKALSTATGNIVDESGICTSLLSRFLAKYWMRLIWGHPLGILCHLRRNTIKHLRSYPVEEGAKHKQLALARAGFLHSLMHGSEGGIDGSNLPYSYVSLPFKAPNELAEQIRQAIQSALRKNVTVMIVDTDKTFTFMNFHFTPRPVSTQGIRSLGGVLAYALGRFLKFDKRATPIVISGSTMDPETALNVADLANRARGCGAGRTVWDMAETFDVPLTQVTWQMLDRIEHKPIVIVRAKRKNT